jgi:lycopene beta-cyclase
MTGEAESVERVLIPMGAGVPARRQRVVGFGAAAGYVHPATGYSVAASLRAAPRVARALSSALGRTEDPDALARAAWRAVWPPEQRHARALHDYGLTTVLRMTHREITVFFEAFFSLPTAEWSAYLRLDTTGRAVAAAMTGVFRSVPWALRRRLVLGSPSTVAALLR